MKSILIIEDDTTFLEILSGFLIKHKFQVFSATSKSEALKQLQKQSFDLVLSDYRLPDGNAMEILDMQIQRAAIMPTVIMTSFQDIRTAVKAMQMGARDYITKPINPEELLLIIHRVLKDAQSKERASVNKLIKGESSIAHKMYEHISLVAPTNMSVVLQGESGTGKEFAAKTLHEESTRKDKAFVAIDCGALSKDLAASELFGHVKGAFTGALQDKTGQFLAANGGTLFLDEVGNLTYEVQIKLLRAIQERVIQPLGSTQQIPVDVRLITATNDDLLMSVEQGEFREDLYHRINEFKIKVPPLRERGSDIKLFINHFRQLSNQELNKEVTEIDPKALEILLNYEWPGNLREMRNVVKRMILLSSNAIAGMDTLPEEMLWALPKSQKPGNSDLKAIQEENEKALIQQTLIKTKYNKSLTAKILNIDRKTLYNKMDRYGLD